MACLWWIMSCHILFIGNKAPCNLRNHLSVSSKPEELSHSTEDYYKSQTTLGVLAILYSSVFPSLPPFDKQFLQMLRNLFSQMLISNDSYSFEANYQMLTLCPHSYLSQINHFITWTSVSTYFPLVNPNKTIKFFIKVLLLIY